MKDLEFHVGKEGEAKADKVLTDFDIACGYAVSLATRTGAPHGMPRSGSTV